MDCSQKIDMRDTNGAYADRHQDVTVGESQDRLTYILSKKIIHYKQYIIIIVCIK